VSVQGLLEDALRPIEGNDVSVQGAGRTDAGVHALGQVANVRLAAAIDTAALGRALNAVLPPAVRVISVEDVAMEFHARFAAVAKTYEYRIATGPFVSPFEHRYVWHILSRLDVPAMRQASASLVGLHDFAAFQGAGSDVPTTERTIHSLDWSEDMSVTGPHALVTMRIEGSGFLRHMVRNIAGTLVEVGFGRWEPARVVEILASKDRRIAGKTAPAAGLFLASVKY
jgi:tRNA pseudouridine38-40 synthase